MGRFVQKVGNGRIFYLWGTKLNPDELIDLCREYDVLIAPQWDERVDGKCAFWGKKRLRYDESLAFEGDENGLQIETARQKMAGGYGIRIDYVRNAVFSTCGSIRLICLEPSPDHHDKRGSHMQGLRPLMQ